MSEHNKSSSSDESWHKLALRYDEFDVLLSDINNEELVEIGLTKGIEHLSSGIFPSSAFPVTGAIRGRNLRYMVPLICQRAGKQTLENCRATKDIMGKELVKLGNA